jgi:hypothetical protein
MTGGSFGFQWMMKHGSTTTTLLHVSEITASLDFASQKGEPDRSLNPALIST